MSSKSSEPICVKFGLKQDTDFYQPRLSLANVYQTDAPAGISISNGKHTESKQERLASNAKITFPTLNAEDEAKRKEKKRSQLIRQCVEYLSLECSNSRLGKHNFYQAFLNKEILSRIFQLFDHNEDGYLSQEDWVEFIKERLLDAKQADLAEELESKAYVICGHSKVSLEKFYQIFQVKGIVDKVFRLIDKDCDGWVTPEQIMEVISALTSPRTTTGFDKENLIWLEQLFRQTVGNETEIKENDFKKIVMSKNPFFTERVFRIFDKDNSGSISLQEFLDAMHQFAGQSPEDKIKFLFKVYDIDGDGLIHPKELQNVIRACMEENGMRFSDEQIDDLTMALFEDADCETQGAIDYVALKNQLERHDGMLQNLSISIDRWLVPPKPKCNGKPLTTKLLSLIPYQLTLPYIRNNYVFLTFLTIFLAVNVVLFITRAIEYSDANLYTIFARACGQCLNFNCAFTLILVLRHFITCLRTRGASSFLPLDHHIYFHKITGIFILIYSIVHTAMHLMNFGLVVVKDEKLNAGNFTFAEWILTPNPRKFGLIDGWANPTGIVLTIILILMVVCSHPLVRRSGCFEVFYWTHLLHIPFLILLLIHNQNFWKWFIVPGFGYLLEWAIGFAARTTCRGKTYISSGLLLPSKVTHLVIKRPPQFYFHPGDYVFVKIPAIANYEWHPFTISSAPEQEDYMWLHIRGTGGWTNSLYNYFEKEQEKLHYLNEHPSQNGTIQNDNGGIKGLKATLERTISGGNKSAVNKTTTWQKKAGYINPNFSSLPENLEIENFPHSAASDSVKTSCHESNSSNNADKLSAPQDKKYQKFFYRRKTPLSKSRSMPDIDYCLKNKERLLTLREYSRSESEKSFDECQMKKARLRSVGLAYLNPQNRSLAHSFRYMRNKPTIIAFKTPSIESNIPSETRLKNSDSDLAAEEGRLKMSCKKPNNCQAGTNYSIGKPLEIYIDGPYGAPSSHIFRAQHAVLVATGIGVTPFASILQSIMHRYWKARQTCPKCTHTWVCDIPPTVMNLRKVDFFWINRDQRSFEWFVNLLSQLEIEQAELGGAMVRFLEMHMYITSALQKTDMKAVGLQLALDLLHEKEKRDLITGLKTRTNAGRPNWDKVFKQLLDQKKGKITVFYCGPPQLGKLLRVKCDQFGFVFRKEIF